MSISLEDYSEDYDEAYDEPSGEGYEEAVRRPRIPLARPSTPPQRPTDHPVTQAQLQMAIAGVNKSIRTNSAAIATVNRTLGRVDTDVRQAKKQSATTRRDIGTLRDAVVLGPLLSSTVGTSNSALGALLPMMLVGGIGDGASQSSGGGLFGGGDQMTTMLMVLVLSGALNTKG